MLLEELLVIDERRILAHLLGDLGVAVKKLIQACELARLLASLKALLLMHERAGILADLLSHSRVCLNVLLQCRMTLDEFLVTNQRGIPAQLLSDLCMRIHEHVEAR